MTEKDKKIIKRILKTMFLQDLRHLDLELFLDCWEFDVDSLEIVADRIVLIEEVESFAGFGTKQEIEAIGQEFLNENNEELYKRYLHCKDVLG